MKHNRSVTSCHVHLQSYQQQTSFISDKWFHFILILQLPQRILDIPWFLSWSNNITHPIKTQTHTHTRRLTLRLLPWPAFGIVVGIVVGQFATFASRHGSEEKPKISKTCCHNLQWNSSSKQTNRNTISEIERMVCCLLKGTLLCHRRVTVGRVILYVSCHATLLVQNTVDFYACVTV